MRQGHRHPASARIKNLPYCQPGADFGSQRCMSSSAALKNSALCANSTSSVTAHPPQYPTPCKVPDTTVRHSTMHQLNSHPTLHVDHHSGGSGHPAPDRLVLSGFRANVSCHPWQCNVLHSRPMSRRACLQRSLPWPSWWPYSSFCQVTRTRMAWRGWGSTCSKFRTC